MIVTDAYWNKGLVNYYSSYWNIGLMNLLLIQNTHGSNHGQKVGDPTLCKPSHPPAAPSPFPPCSSSLYWCRPKWVSEQCLVVLNWLYSVGFWVQKVLFLFTKIKRYAKCWGGGVGVASKIGEGSEPRNPPVVAPLRIHNNCEL